MAVSGLNTTLVNNKYFLHISRRDISTIIPSSSINFVEANLSRGPTHLVTTLIVNTNTTTIDEKFDLHNFTVFIVEFVDIYCSPCSGVSSNLTAWGSKNPTYLARGFLGGFWRNRYHVIFCNLLQSDSRHRPTA